MTPDTVAVAYVENRFGPNWRQVLAFRDFAASLREETDLGKQIRELYYSDGDTSEPVSLVSIFKLMPEGTPRGVYRQMSRASDGDCPGIGNALFATASVAAAFAARPYLSAESFDRLTAPLSVPLGDQWTGFLAGLDPMPPVDTPAEAEASR